jgi:hypothetical protein
MPITATEIALEEAITNQLQLIENLQAEKTSLEAQINQKNIDITDVQNRMNNDPFWQVVGQNFLAQFTAERNNLQNTLNGVISNLEAAQVQLQIDQENLRDYQIANMSAEELGDFLEVEQDAAARGEMLKSKQRLYTIAGIVIIIVGGLFLWKYLKKKKLIKK